MEGYIGGQTVDPQVRLLCLAAQFGHLFAKGDNREGAIRAMVVALKEVKIRGEIRTTVDYCVEMIQSPDFVGNNIHTGWLDARITSHVSGRPCPPLCFAGSPVEAAQHRTGPFSSFWAQASLAYMAEG